MALSGEPKNKRGKRKIVHCLKLLTQGRSKFGQFSLTSAGFLSEAGIALPFLLPFCGKWNIPTAASGIKRKVGVTGAEAPYLILKCVIQVNLVVANGLFVQKIVTLHYFSCQALCGANISIFSSK